MTYQEIIEGLTSGSPMIREQAAIEYLKLKHGANIDYPQEWR